MDRSISQVQDTKVGGVRVTTDAEELPGEGIYTVECMHDGSVNSTQTGATVDLCIGPRRLSRSQASCGASLAVATLPGLHTLHD